MDLLKQISRQLLVGSERQQPEIPETTGALAGLIRDICADCTDVETNVLRVAGTLAVYAQAGFQPPLQDVGVVPVCDDESLPVLHDGRFAECLQLLLREGSRRVLLQALDAIAQRQYVVPHGLLPGLLTLGKSDKDLVQAIIPVCGQRGFWLARLNTEWEYLLDHDKPVGVDVWEHGSLHQRLVFIKQLRTTDANQARELIGQALGESSASERTAFVEALGVQLSLADEAFLQTRLSDRSKDVRHAAASLLSQLPGSEFVNRMQMRISDCLHKEEKYPARWLISAPESFKAGWSADVLDEKRPQHETLGDKAWWLFQVASHIPLAWWEEKLSMSVEALIEWASASDWSQALLRAWYKAIVREKNPRWSAVFLHQVALKDFSLDTFQLMEFLPGPLREKQWNILLENEKSGYTTGECIRIMVGQGVGDLSAGFLNNTLGSIRKKMADGTIRQDYVLRQSLLDFVCFIPPDCLVGIEENWLPEDSQGGFFTETFLQMLTIIEQRKLIIHFLKDA